MKTLVTGGGGFLGRYIVARLLADGRKVAILGRRSHPDLAKQGVECIEADIGDRDAVIEACRGCETVYHTAAIAGIWGARELFWRTNVEGARNVIAGCQAHNVKKLIYTSTPSVVFSGGDLRGVDESQPYGDRFLCHYAETKAIAEREALAADRINGLRTVALRPHLIWGVGDNHLIPRVVERARQRRLRIIGEGNNKVDIVHVDNAADAHLLAERALDGAAPAAGKPYFITDGKPIVLWKWINALLQRLDLPPVERKVSLKAAYMAGAVFEAIYGALRLRGEPRMTRFVAVELAKDHYFNIDAARRDIGYKPRENLDEAMGKLVAWMAKQKP